MMIDCYWKFYDVIEKYDGKATNSGAKAALKYERDRAVYSKDAYSSNHLTLK